MAEDNVSVSHTQVSGFSVRIQPAGYIGSTGQNTEIPGYK